jgi:uncharacterized membrane protein
MMRDSTKIRAVWCLVGAICVIAVVVMIITISLAR